jgi:hypothetical protein
VDNSNTENGPYVAEWSGIAVFDPSMSMKRIT